MAKKKICIFVPADANNDRYFTMFEKSLRKFHSEENLPLLRYDNQSGDPNFWYRAKPLIASKLLEEYETVIGADADQIILAPLTEIIDDTDAYDVGVVLNDASYKIQLWDIAPYFNNGLVVMKSKAFADHWLRLCMSPHFNTYQFREQDLLNILCSDYHNYQVKCFDTMQKVYGEAAKSRWIEAKMVDDKVMIGETQLMIYHSGGGNTPDKMKYHLRFQPEVAKYMDGLIL
jgi:lipopolysaccharide biosynthesis glycosyltransferase